MYRSDKTFTILGHSFSIAPHPYIPCVLNEVTFFSDTDKMFSLNPRDFIKDVSSSDEPLLIKYQPLSPSAKVLEKYKISSELFSEIAEEMARVLTTPCDVCGECIHY